MHPDNLDMSGSDDDGVEAAQIADAIQASGFKFNLGPITGQSADVLIFDENGGAEPDVDAAFAQTPAAVFDLELPWTNDCGVIKNKYGIRVAKFENWEQADAVVATMNGSQQLIDAVAALNDATKPVVDVVEARKAIDKTDAMTFMGIPLVVNKQLPDGTFITREEYERIAMEAQQALGANAQQLRPRIRFS